VQSGAYSSASEVIQAGLRTLQERDSSIERWLQEEVVPVYDAMQRDPGRALSAEELIADIRAHPAKRSKSPA
jgi:antitoxin ParD1/3/4